MEVYLGGCYLAFLTLPAPARWTQFLHLPRDHPFLESWLLLILQVLNVMFLERTFPVALCAWHIEGAPCKRE